MANNSGQAGVDENQLHGEESNQFVKSDENEHARSGNQGVVPKVKEEDSDEEMNDEEGDVYKIMSNVKVTINENVEGGTVNPLPKVSKASNVKFEDYDFEEVDMKEVVNEKAETPEDGSGVKEEDGLLTPKIEPSNPDEMGPNLLQDLVLGVYGKQLLQKSNAEESKLIQEQAELVCHYCLKQFSKRSALMCHVKDVHEKNGDFACGFCEKRFYRKSALIDHERKHTGEKPFVCIECGKAYDRKSYLNIHMQMHGERYPCGICEKTFSLKKNLGKHIKYVHEKVKNFCCETCSKTFGRSEHLKRHIEDMHENRGEYIHKCEQCDSSFRKEDQLKAHNRNVHLNENNFVCDTCAKAFSMKASLDRHIADVHEQSGSNACQFCEKRFYKPHALKIHERKHTNEKPFACGFCDKKYHRAMDKDAHERKHTGEKPFQCDSCGASFRSQALKRYHMKSHAEVVKQENEHLDPNDMQLNVFNGLNSIRTNQNTTHTKEKNSHEDRSQEFKQDQMKSSEEESQAMKQDHVNSYVSRSQVLEQDNMNMHVDKRQTMKKDHMNTHEDSSQDLEQDHVSSHEIKSQAIKKDCFNTHVDRSQELEQDNINSHIDKSWAVKRTRMNSHVDSRQALRQDHRNSHEDTSQSLKQDDINSHEDRSQVLKQDHMNFHVNRSQAFKQDHMNSQEDRSQAFKQDHMNSHVDRSQVLKQDHMQSHVEDLKNTRASVFQPNLHNVLNLPMLNNQPAQPHRSPNNLYTPEKLYSSESFKSQVIRQDHLKTHVKDDVLNHRSAQFDPSALQTNLYNTLYSPHSIVNKQTNTTRIENPFQEVSKDRYEQYYRSVPQPDVYNYFNSHLPLMKKQAAMYRSSQSTASTSFQSDSIRSQAEKQYGLKFSPEVQKEGSEQFVPSLVQPNANSSPFSPQPKMNHYTEKPGNSLSDPPSTYQ